MDQAQNILKGWWFDRVSELATSVVQLQAALGEREQQIAAMQEKIEELEKPAASPPA